MRRSRMFLIFLFAVLAAVAAHSEPVAPGKDVLYPSPSLTVSGSGPSYWGAGVEAVYKTLLRNLHGPNYFYDTRYAYPSPIFRGIYLWDTAFTAQVWKPWDTATADEINRTVIKNAAADGRLQHFYSIYSQSEFTQPPVMAWSVWRNYLASGDKAALARDFPALEAYNQWLYRERRLENGLFFWLHSYESGIDNSPRFGSTDESYMVDMPSLAAIDLNSYLVLQNRALANMAAELGQPDKASLYNEKAAELAALVNQKMWDPESGLYYDLDTRSGQLVKINTVASLFPLFAGIPDQERAQRLLAHIMDPAEYNTLIPLGSVAHNDPSFEKDMWRGPVWINTAYMVVRGMDDYDFQLEKSLIAWKLVDGVYASWKKTGKLVEFYDPDRHDFVELHRKKGNLYKQITLGGKPRPNFAGWTGLANTMLIEDLVGYRVELDREWIRPAFPGRAAGSVFHLSMPRTEVEIELTVEYDGSTSGWVEKDGTKKEFRLAPGESFQVCGPGIR